MRIRGMTIAAAVAAAWMLGTAPAASAQSLSSGAKYIYDEALRDKRAVRAACAAGKEGMINYVTEVVTKMIRSGEMVDTSNDAPAARKALLNDCPKITGG